MYVRNRAPAPAFLYARRSYSLYRLTPPLRQLFENESIVLTHSLLSLAYTLPIPLPPYWLALFFPFAYHRVHFTMHGPDFTSSSFRMYLTLLPQLLIIWEAF